MKDSTVPLDPDYKLEQVALDYKFAQDELLELIERRDSISEKLMAVTLDGNDPVTHDQYQMMLSREERLTKRVGNARQEVRRLHARYIETKWA
jgi:hypothetical protein